MNWVLCSELGDELARAPLVVVAAAIGSAALLDSCIRVHPVRGQVSWAMQTREDEFAPFPIHGNGHLIAGIPHAQGHAFFCGSTFQPGEADLSARESDHRHNLQRLQRLSPQAAIRMESLLESHAMQAWCGVRCASEDRRPLVGEVQPGLWVSTAMGSRGLTFSSLCAELIAAHLHDEPLPLDDRLAQALGVERQGRAPCQNN